MTDLINRQEYMSYYVTTIRFVPLPYRFSLGGHPERERSRRGMGKGKRDVGDLLFTLSLRDPVNFDWEN